MDGDTLDVRVRRGVVKRVRLLGIDTPEVYGVTECGGPQASRAMRKLAAGRRVKLVGDANQPRRDRHGRLLAYVNRGARSLQLTMLARGSAHVDVVGRPFTRLARFQRAQHKARVRDRGVWGLCGGALLAPSRASEVRSAAEQLGQPLVGVGLVTALLLELDGAAGRRRPPRGSPPAPGRRGRASTMPSRCAG